jgi:hypothetical protein
MPDRRVGGQRGHHSNNVKRLAANPTMAPISPRSPELNQLVAEPRETLDAEVKEWLDLTSNDHRALVAKEVIALANHGGGYLVIGFEELADGSFKPAGSRPPTLNAWSQDAIQSIVGKYIDPTIQCRVVHQAPSASADRYPIVGRSLAPEFDVLADIADRLNKQRVVTTPGVLSRVAARGPQLVSSVAEATWSLP